MELELLGAVRDAETYARVAALLVAAVAERHGVVVLHHNTVFDLIVKVTGQKAEWVK